MPAGFCSKYCGNTAESPAIHQFLLVETGGRKSQKTGNLLGFWKRKLTLIGRKIGQKKELPAHVGKHGGQGQSRLRRLVMGRF